MDLSLRTLTIKHHVICLYLSDTLGPAHTRGGSSGKEIIVKSHVYKEEKKAWVLEMRPDSQGHAKNVSSS